MVYAFYIFASSYAGLCVLAPIMRAKQWKECPSMVAMLTGGLSLGTSLILKSSGYHKAWMLAAAALICIALSAWKNGGMQEKRHLSHHVMRWGLSVAILVGFIWL